MQAKPLGAKNYGSIPHIPGSRVGIGDHTCSEGEKRIALEKPRDRFDHIILQEKLDGSNVGVARIDGELFALNRAGYLASSSPYKQHQVFSQWVEDNKRRFLAVLKDGERLVGEWLLQAHGTRYNLAHEPFVAFDLMQKDKKLPFHIFKARIAQGIFEFPHTIQATPGIPIGLDKTNYFGTFGFHGAIDPIEGFVWRVERDEVRRKGERERIVSYLIKYVKPDKVDGCYLPEMNGTNLPIYNNFPQFEEWKERYGL